MIREFFHKLLFFKEAQELQRLRIKAETLQEQLKRFDVSEFEKWLDNNYPLTRIKYKKRWIFNLEHVYEMDIRDYCNDYRSLPVLGSLKEVFEYPISYVSDSFDAQKLIDFWQLPVETMALKCGDCDDSGALRLALARRMGNKDVFCALGFYGKMGHFFNLEWKKGEAYIVENTTNRYNPIRIPDNDLKTCPAPYSINYVFNENKVWVVDNSVVFGHKVDIRLK